MIDKSWTMEDFTTGPVFGEVGHIGDIDDLREYPCNCVNCVCAGMETDLEKAEYRAEVAEQKLADIWDIVNGRFTFGKMIRLVRERMSRK